MNEKGQKSMLRLFICAVVMVVALLLHPSRMFAQTGDASKAVNCLTVTPDSHKTIAADFDGHNATAYDHYVTVQNNCKSRVSVRLWYTEDSRNAVGDTIRGGRKSRITMGLLKPNQVFEYMYSAEYERESDKKKPQGPSSAKVGEGPASAEVNQDPTASRSGRPPSDSQADEAYRETMKQACMTYYQADSETRMMMEEMWAKAGIGNPCR